MLLHIQVSKRAQVMPGSWGNERPPLVWESGLGPVQDEAPGCNAASELCRQHGSGWLFRSCTDHSAGFLLQSRLGHRQVDGRRDVDGSGGDPGVAWSVNQATAKREVWLVESGPGWGVGAWWVAQGWGDWFRASDLRSTRKELQQPCRCPASGRKRWKEPQISNLHHHFGILFHLAPKINGTPTSLQGHNTRPCLSTTRSPWRCVKHARNLMGTRPGQEERTDFGRCPRYRSSRGQGPFESSAASRPTRTDIAHALRQCCVAHPKQASVLSCFPEVVNHPIPGNAVLNTRSRGFGSTAD